MNLKECNLVKYLNYIMVVSLSLVLAFSMFDKRLLKVCFVAAVLSWILSQILQNKNKFYRFIIPKTFLNKAIGLFVLASFLSVIFSIDFKYSQRVFFERYLPFIVFFFLGVGLTKENIKYTKVLIYVFLLSGFFMALGGVWDYIQLGLSGRLFTVFGKRYLSLHYYLMLLAPLATIIFLFSKHKILKIVSGLTAIPATLCLVWNFYRGAVSGFFVSLVTISWVKNKKLVIGLILILLIISFFFLPQRYINRMETSIDSNTWGDRIPMWKSAVSIWQDYPVFGVGIRKYRDLMFLYEPTPESIGRNLNHAHNTYFQILAEMGIIGLISFFYIFYLFFKNIWVKRKKILDSEEFGIIGGVTAVIITSLIFSCSAVLFILLPSHSSMLWLLFGIGVGQIEKIK